MKSFADVEVAIRDYPVKRVAVAVAESHSVLEALAEANRRNIAEPTLVGDEAVIRSLAEQHEIDLDDAVVVHEPEPTRAAAKATALVSRGEADILMKGHIHTDDFLRAVLDRDTGLRTGSILSHVFLVERPEREHFLLVSDGAMNIAPDLERKSAIILNAVHAANVFGIEEPRVAILAAIELVNPAMPASVDAATLHMMCTRHQFSPQCIVEGPFAFDNAINEAAARDKNITGPVAGKADVLIVPDIEAGNILVKSFVYMAGFTVAGLVVGAAAPVVLTSRADTTASKLASIACAVYTANVQRALRLKVGKVRF
ncbi:bifunctional enoyl-CoA hydratase/phosphate acetyltransferase [bacterium]|nr:bifunctional enoyl-CoA hydratase/phosphate acetyltransferase [bacterium]